MSGGGRINWGVFSLAVLVALLVMPSTAAGQAPTGIAGTVTDATGGVLPGVTVEARSPALIEEVRVGSTDGQGQYRILLLRPGVYTVTFSLPGFSTVERVGIELESFFTAPVNVEMTLGEVAETITVTGASPVVDVQTTTRSEVINRDLIEQLPTGRQYHFLINTVPAVNSGDFDVGGDSGMENQRAAAYGGDTQDQAYRIDGMALPSMCCDGSSISLYMDTAPVQEYVVQVSAANAEAQTGGLQINVIPREGSNTFSGRVEYLGTGSAFQGGNVDQALIDQGIPAETPAFTTVYDFNAMAGGAIVSDRLWFFGSQRSWTFNKEVFGLFHDGILGAPGEPVEEDDWLASAHLRLTGQVNPTNKITIMYERDYKTRIMDGIERGGRRPESVNSQYSPLSMVGQVKYTSTLSNSLLLEAGWSMNHWTGGYAFRRKAPRIHDVTPELPLGPIRKVDLNVGIPFGAPVRERWWPTASHWYSGSLSYVTGSHNIKGGTQIQHGRANRVTRSPAAVEQRYRDGIPVSARLYNHPIDSTVQLNASIGLYIQDSWTLGRLTVNGGIRYDYVNSEIPAQSVGGGRWVGPRAYQRIQNVPLWHDVAPRIGGAYDLSGDGRTVIKGSVGEYVSAQLIGLAVRYNPMIIDTDTRNWDDLNGDDIADLEELGPSNNSRFGESLARTRRMDPDRQRSRNKLYNVTFEHELQPGLGLSVAFNRRTYSDLWWTDNLSTTSDDFTLLTTPDPRGNGEMLPVYNVNSAKRGLIDQLDLTSDQNTNTYNGFDVTLHGRLPNGAQFQGGTSTGRTLLGTCQTDNPNDLRFCDQGQYDVPLRTNFKAVGSYPLPRGLMASAVFQSYAGEEFNIIYAVNRSQLPDLTLSSVRLQLNEPGTEFYPRVNQLDLALTGFISLGGMRLEPRVDLFNATNTNVTLNQTNRFGSSLGTATRILSARFLRFGIGLSW